MQCGRKAAGRPRAAGPVAGPARKREDKGMEHANHCINCTVRSCAHHCACDDYCSLDRIQVGTHEPHPSMDECTDCQSFQKK